MGAGQIIMTRGADLFASPYPARLSLLARIVGCALSGCEPSIMGITAILAGFGKRGRQKYPFLGEKSGSLI